MAKKKKKTRKSRALVLGYLERISSEVFSDFPKQLIELVGKQHGVYALYKGYRLYYVGLAKDLRGRVKKHRRDKHAGKWDNFSFYLVRKVDHIKELESLIMRIAEPAGNATRGRLPRADNLWPKLDRSIAKELEKIRIKIRKGFKHGKGGLSKHRTPKKSRRRKKGRLSKESRQPVLAPYVKKRFKIRGSVRGKIYTAKVHSNGKINFNGTLYNSPSMAAQAALGRTSNGWWFWYYKNRKGEWVRLNELRK